MRSPWNSDSYTCLDGFILSTGNLLYFKCYTWSLDNRVKEITPRGLGWSPSCNWGRHQESQQVVTGSGWVPNLLRKEAVQSHGWMDGKVKDASAIQNEDRFQRELSTVLHPERQYVTENALGRRGWQQFVLEIPEHVQVLSKRSCNRKRRLHKTIAKQSAGL